MKMRCLFSMMAICGMLVVFGCNGDEVSKSDNGGFSPAPESEKTSSTDSEGYLVSENSDGLCLKVKCEKLGNETFRLHYVFENTRSEIVYRVVSRHSPYFVLIRPIDAAQGESVLEYQTPRPADMKAEELMILFGINRSLDNVLREAMENPDGVPMEAGKSVSGSVDIQFPIKRTSHFGVFEEGRGEDEIYEMAKSEYGVPCVVAFNYMTLQGFNDMYAGGITKSDEKGVYRQVPYWASKLIESKRMILKIK